MLDHCRAIDLILKDGKPGETYNIGSGLELDVEQIASLLLEEFGLDITYKTYVPDRPGHDRRYLLDSSKIQRGAGLAAANRLCPGLQGNGTLVPRQPGLVGTAVKEAAD